MSEDKPNSDVEIYRKWFKDERVREVLSQNEHAMDRIFNDRKMQDILFSNEEIKKSINENGVYVKTANGTLLIHKSELPFYASNDNNSDV